MIARVVKGLMPTRPPRPCNHPGCPALVSEGSYCAAHQRAKRGDYDVTTRKQDPSLAQAAALRNTSRWRRLSARFRRAHPICCDPFCEGCDGLTAVANHAVSLQLAPARAYDWENLTPLCTRCDARVGSLERQGKDAASLFAGWRERYILTRKEGQKS